MAKDRSNIVDITRQSKPIQLSEPYDPAWVTGKTILITGGASGFGEGFSRKWAARGANIMIGDINDGRGKAMIEELRKETGNQNHHFFHCDVTIWQSQVDFFHFAAKLSPHGGIDAVVANAGIPDLPSTLELPENLDADEPPAPNFKCVEVDVIGVMYTIHLAYFYLPRNPQSEAANPSRAPAPNTRDRHLLLIGSIAGLDAIPGQILYCASKHAVTGLFRGLRSTSFTKGIRVNLLCPYFIDTPIVPTAGRVLLAGAGLGKPEDVVEAGTRMMADSRIAGRALVIGPKVKVDGDWNLLSKDADVEETAIWEPYAHDFEEVEAFSRRFVRLLNSVENARGWIGWASDMVGAFSYPLRNWWRS